MKNLTLIFSLLLLATLPAWSAEVSDCSTDVLPDGSKECVFRHVPYKSFKYTAGRLEVHWPRKYVMKEVFVATDWKKSVSYLPGSEVRLELSPESRYDIVARFRDRETGEDFLGLTPVACRSRVGSKSPLGLIPAPPEGCNFPSPAAGCGISSEADCTDGDGNVTGTVSVSCEGDKGSCDDDCGDSETACCNSNRTRSDTDSDGTQSSVTTVMQNTQSCPE